MDDTKLISECEKDAQILNSSVLARQGEQEADRVYERIAAEILRAGLFETPAQVVEYFKVPRKFVAIYAQALYLNRKAEKELANKSQKE